MDSPKKSNSGVGICAGSLDSFRADALDRRMQTPGNGRSRVGPIAIEGAEGSPVNDRKKSTDLTRVHRSTAKPVGESEFMGSKAPSGRGVHNFGIPIHNLWDKKIRNLWDSSIIYGTASQSDPCLAGPR